MMAEKFFDSGQFLHVAQDSCSDNQVSFYWFLSPDLFSLACNKKNCTHSFKKQPSLIEVPSGKKMTESVIFKYSHNSFFSNLKNCLCKFLVTLGVSEPNHMRE